MTSRQEKQQAKYAKAKAHCQVLYKSAEKKQTGPSYEKDQKPEEKK